MRPQRANEVAYAGVGLTFCRRPLVLEPVELAGADVAILGAPFDEDVSFRPGARFGPRAIHQAADVGGGGPRPHMELGIDPFDALNVVDYGDIEATPANLAASDAELQRRTVEILAAGRRAALPHKSAGGDRATAGCPYERLTDGS